MSSDSDPSAEDAEVIRRRAKRMDNDSGKATARGKAAAKAKKAAARGTAEAKKSKSAAKGKLPSKGKAGSPSKPATTSKAGSKAAAAVSKKIATLVARVESLERRGRQLWLTVLALGLGLIGLAAYPLVAKKPVEPNPPPVASEDSPETGASEQAEPVSAEPAVAGSASDKALADRISLLEARNELTKLADQAISKGSRYAYRKLERSFSEPEFSELKDAANAELIRVESHYVSTRRYRGYSLPLAKLFPRVKDESALGVEELGSVIRTETFPWEARARAVQLMARFKTPRSAHYLMGAMETDPNLAVVQEAILAFGKVTGYQPNAVLDPRSSVAWWQDNRAAFEEASQ